MDCLSQWILLQNRPGCSTLVPTGPYTLNELRAELNRGVISYQHFAWREGMSQWQRLWQIADFQAMPELPEEKPRALQFQSHLTFDEAQSAQWAADDSSLNSKLLLKPLSANLAELWQLEQNFEQLPASQILPAQPQQQTQLLNFEAPREMETIAPTATTLESLVSAQPELQPQPASQPQPRPKPQPQPKTGSRPEMLRVALATICAILAMALAFKLISFVREIPFPDENGEPSQLEP